MSNPDQQLPRREYLRQLVAAGGVAALAACLDETGDEQIPTGAPSGRPRRQHAWNDALTTDTDGNPQRAKHHVLLPLSLVQSADEQAREQTESAFRSLESAYAYDSEGLLFTVGYSTSYFDRVDIDSPIPEPEALTGMESPDFDQFDTLVHLASANPEVVLAAEQALLGNEPEPNGVEMDATLDGVFEQAEPRRTGFVGPGLPADYTEMDGVPNSIPEEAPFFMGFRSGFRESQATESRVTIESGPYAGGTTTHVESLNIQLETWFEQDNHPQRVAKLFSPAHAREQQVGETGEKLDTATGVGGDIAEQTNTDARTEGVVGHAQKAARARDEDGPPLLRRDFNTVDTERPGLHFLAHQETIEDFERTRTAMAGQGLVGEGVGQRLNNGILQYIFVRRRGNYLVPPRDLRSLPTVSPTRK